jgi:NADPH-dependent curcumin reductase CurA
MLVVAAAAGAVVVAACDISMITQRRSVCWIATTKSRYAVILEKRRARVNEKKYMRRSSYDDG